MMMMTTIAALASYTQYHIFVYNNQIIINFTQVEMHYAIVQFKLLILDGQDGYIGKHNTLRLVEHSSAAIINGRHPSLGHWGSEWIQHKLPNRTDMQFWRYWHWNSNNSNNAIC